MFNPNLPLTFRSTPTAMRRVRSSLYESEMSIFRKAIREDFIIVAISSGLTMNEHSHQIMTALIDTCSPSYCQMLNPDSYIAYFRSKHSVNRQRADKLLSNVQKMIATDDRFADFTVGMNEGTVVSEINWRGKVTVPPVGDAVNAAYRNQKGRQDLNNQSLQEGL